MKRLVIFVLLSIFLNSPAVCRAQDDTLDTGRNRIFNYWFFKVPIGSGAKPDSVAAKEKKGEEEVKKDEKKEADSVDKKVDDAIKKAWGEK